MAKLVSINGELNVKKICFENMIVNKPNTIKIIRLFIVSPNKNASIIIII